MSVAPKRGLHASKKVRPCPCCYAPLDEQLVCKLHGPLEECRRCKHIKHPVTNACACLLKVVAPKPPKPPQPRRKPGPRPVKLKECVFCGKLSRRKFCADHKSLYQTVRYWCYTKKITVDEAVELIKNGAKNDKKSCSGCGRPIAYVSRTSLCRKCQLRSRPPKRICVACGGPAYSEKGYFCKEVRCSRLSISFSYYKRCGKPDDEILIIMQPRMERVRQGLEP